MKWIKLYQAEAVFRTFADRMIEQPAPTVPMFLNSSARQGTRAQLASSSPDLASASDPALAASSDLAGNLLRSPIALDRYKEESRPSRKMRSH